jgi:hypothetical protein
MREELSEIVARRLEQQARALCGDERWNHLIASVIQRDVDPWAAADEMIGPLTERG